MWTYHARQWTFTVLIWQRFNVFGLVYLVYFSTLLMQCVHYYTLGGPGGLWIGAPPDVSTDLHFLLQQPNHGARLKQCAQLRRYLTA